MKHSYPANERLTFLLAMIHNGEMALPDFQRDFVWDPSATDLLIESIISNFPAGTLLRIKNGEQLLFQPREFAGAPELADGSKPAYLILDGQQRLTSLYQAFHGVGEYRFYLNLAALEAGKDLEDCCFYLRARDGDKRYGTIEQQAETLVFPLARLTERPGGFSAWQNQVMRVRGGDDAAKILDLQQRLAQLHDQWVEPIEEYEFPTVTLNEDTSGPAVCMIFETLNRTGVKLGPYDLLTARFWPRDFNLRQKWEEAQDDNSILTEFEIDPYYLLQVIALLEPGMDKDGKVRAPSVKRRAILDMKVGQAECGWDAAVAGLADALKILRAECGVLVPSLLPYNTIVIPMAAAWASQKDAKGAAIGANRVNIVRWFWCSVFGQTYESSPNSQAEKDFAELQRWMSGGQPPDSVSDFRFDLNLRQVTARQRAVYRGIMALILHNHALDFHKRGEITAQLLDDKQNRVEDHHVFPRAFLDRHRTPTDQRDCILNRTFIDRETNRALSNRAPSDYFSEIRSKHGIKEADDLLKSHLLPEGANSPLLIDDFEGFLDWRERALTDVIRRRTQG